MALAKNKPTEEAPGPAREMTVPELMIEECGLTGAVKAAMDSVKQEVAVLEGIGDIQTKEDEERVSELIKTSQVIVNQLIALQGQVVKHADSKTKQVRDHFTKTINAMKKMRLGLRSALLK